MCSHWEEFYAANPAPADFEENRKKIKDFCTKHDKASKNIVLVTSGGTTVPLEHNTVRFVDNFSAGTRGSSSAEYFLEKGFAVLFLFRLKSLEPYVRHFVGNKFLDMLEIQDNPNKSITVRDECTNSVLPILSKYKSVKENGTLLCMSFTSLIDYLWLLRAACEALAVFESRVILYLAAAVSDFYIPPSKLPTHKMQSEAGPPTISLQLVPKMLEPLVNLWIPKAFVVSFKLETDESILISKARSALEKYHHNMVIGNILQTRKYRVVLVKPTSSCEIVLTSEEVESGIEIESKIVTELLRHYDKFVIHSA